MYYFISILLYLSIPVQEKAITGPFQTLENCLQYREIIINLPKIDHSLRILEAKCVKQEEV